MKSQRFILHTKRIPHPNVLRKEVAVFWDYENVPLRHVDYKGFLKFIHHIMANWNLEFFRIYTRKSTLSDKDYHILKKIGIDPLKHFKFVYSNGKNAVDNSMIAAIKSVVSNKPKIQNIVIISGDGDFTQTIQQLQSMKKKVFCIHQLRDQQSRGIKSCDVAIPMAFLTENPFTTFNFK